MAELAVTVVPAKILADGTHKIRIALFHQHQTRYIITRFKIDSLKQFKGGRVVNHPEASIMNKKINAKLNEYYDILDNIHADSFTCTQLKDYLEEAGAPKKSITSVNECWQIYIEQLQENNQKGTAGLYIRSKNYFEEKFGRSVHLLSFSCNTINTWEKHLHREREMNETTIGMHMRMLRAIINFAKKEGFVKYEIEPFAHYTMPTSRERELDITIEELKRIRDSKPDSRPKIVARDLFMLSYYLGGINLIDLMDVTFTKLDTLTYIRKKTEHTKRGNKEVTITIPEEAKPIIRKWRGKNGKLDFRYKYTYENFRNYITKITQSLANELNINKRVVYYSARKSFVQHGFDLGIPLEILEYTAGQTVKKNRPIFNYIRFMRSHADEAIRKVIDATK